MLIVLSVTYSATQPKYQTSLTGAKCRAECRESRTKVPVVQVGHLHLYISVWFIHRTGTFITRLLTNDPDFISSHLKVGVLEGQVAVRNSSKRLVELSKQNLIDCSMMNLGCDCGFMKWALDFVGTESGINDEQSYPYEAKDLRPCRFNKSKVVFTDHNGALLPAEDEQKLKQVVARFGPVAAAIDAGDIGFINYHSGVYHNQYCDDLTPDHSVLVVGYGTNSKLGDYWIVKNSWGEAWGDKGYIKMARNRDYNCGIATFATIATFH